MKLHEFGSDLNALGNKLDEFRRTRDSLVFCVQIYERYATGSAPEPANAHMDADKARIQLLDAIHRMLKI